MFIGGQLSLYNYAAFMSAIAHIVMYCQFMLSSCLTNHADIKDLWGRTAIDMAREYRHHALANYVEVFQPGPRGVLTISWYL